MTRATGSVLAATLAAVIALATGCSSGSADAESSPTVPLATTSSPSSPVPTPSASPTGATSTPSTKPVAPQRVQLSVVPRRGAEPRVRFPPAPRAVGPGANAVVSAIPDSLWSTMLGYSWTVGCPVGRSALRLVQVNYWGFDGVPHRGKLVVNAAIATRAAAAFTTLWRLRFRIRQMRPMDSAWGHNPKGPGADDYAAMRADNTSAFNCRYVGGEEKSRQWSKHAYGRAIDVNDLENPYVASGGRVFPNSYFLHRRSGAGVFRSSGSAEVRAFTDQGFRWGGLWSLPDLQHMERT